MKHQQQPTGSAAPRGDWWWRFQPPGWLLIVLMTLAFGVSVWALAGDQIAQSLFGS